MLLKFEKRLADFIKSNGLLGPAEKILLAVSGGADSVALMYAMHTLKAEGIINIKLLCAHINHQLRGTQGDLDEEFVVTRAKKLELSATTRHIDVHGFARLKKLSIETAARHLRMGTLIDIAKSNNCSRIATAHQKNDNAETILQRLSRGTGFRGLGGIWPERVFADQIKFIRPLMCFRRDEIVGYLQQRNLKWRRDHTNADCTYRRNYIRHRLMPALQQEFSGSIVEQLSQLAQSARGYYSIVCERANKVWQGLADCDAEKTVLDLKQFMTEPQPVKIELIRRSLANINCGERDLTQGHYQGILRLAKQNVTGSPRDSIRRKMELPGGFAVMCEYENLTFSNSRVGLAPLVSNEPATDHVVTIEIPGQTEFEKFLICAIVHEKNEVDFEKFKTSKTDSIEFFDLEKIKPPLIVRYRCPGDRFVPLGQNRNKKIGKFLTAQRIPFELRRKVFVVADGEKIIWVWPVRISEQSKITDQTQKILQLQITNLNA
jgi:tRNA(Ile)-lysidine synthase